MSRAYTTIPSLKPTIATSGQQTHDPRSMADMADIYRGMNVPPPPDPPEFKTAAAIDATSDRMRDLACRLEGVTQRLARFNQSVSTGQVPECDRKTEATIGNGNTALDRLATALNRAEMAAASLCKEVENL